MVKYSVPASILLSQSLVAASLYDSYVSLSFELIGFPTFAGELHLHDNVFEAHVHALTRIFVLL